MGGCPKSWKSCLYSCKKQWTLASQLKKKDVSFEVLRAVPWHTWQPRRQVLFNHPQIDVNLCCCAFNDSPLTAIPHRVRSTGDDDDSSSTTDGECKPLKTSHKNGTRMWNFGYQEIPGLDYFWASYDEIASLWDFFWSASKKHHKALGAEAKSTTTIQRAPTEAIRQLGFWMGFLGRCSTSWSMDSQIQRMILMISI